ncbi:hypothetical protein ACKKBG_A30965 [Auxenochlorella protothecoides x Auxenochlorella symbiontica]
MNGQDMDVGRIKAELEELTSKQQQIDARLREHSGRGRGRGRGLPGRGGTVSREPPREDNNGAFRGFHGDESFTRRQRGPPGAPHATMRDPGWQNEGRAPAVRDHGWREPPSQQPQESRRRVASTAVAVSSGVAVPSGFGGECDVDDESRGLKREPEGAALEERADIKKRNRRIFGSLLGTLAQFKAAEEGSANLEVSKRRAALLQKAEQRSSNASRLARETLLRQQKDARAEAVAERARVAIEANLKRVELLTAQRLARHACWDAQYLLTPASAGPRLYWRPAKDSVATAGLWAAHKLERAEWKAAQLARLAEEQEAVRCRGQGDPPPPPEQSSPAQDMAVEEGQPRSASLEPSVPVSEEHPNLPADAPADGPEQSALPLDTVLDVIEDV